MMPLLVALAVAGGVSPVQIVGYDVMYCSGVDSYKFEIRIDGQWDFGTMNGEGERATGLEYVLGRSYGNWTRRIEVVGTQFPFRAEIRYYDAPDDPPIAFTPIRFYDAEDGWLLFKLPTWAFGLPPHDVRHYRVTVTAYGEGTSETGVSYHSNTCETVGTHAATWGHVKALYR